jgi:hypothetical protein
MQTLTSRPNFSEIEYIENRLLNRDVLKQAKKWAVDATLKYCARSDMAFKLHAACEGFMNGGVTSAQLNLELAIVIDTLNTSRYNNQRALNMAYELGCLLDTTNNVDAYKHINNILSSALWNKNMLQSFSAALN